MPLLEFRGECSDLLDLQIEAARGPIPREQFLLHACSIGLGHVLEEILQQGRQAAYDALSINTGAFSAAKEQHRLALAATRPAAAVMPLGADITRPRNNR